MGCFSKNFQLWQKFLGLFKNANKVKNQANTVFEAKTQLKNLIERLSDQKHLIGKYDDVGFTYYLPNRQGDDAIEVIEVAYDGRITIKDQSVLQNLFDEANKKALSVNFPENSTVKLGEETFSKGNLTIDNDGIVKFEGILHNNLRGSLIDDLVSQVNDAYKTSLKADLQASDDLAKLFNDKPELLKSWETLKRANVDDAIRTNVNELTDVSKHSDDIDNFGGYNTWRLRTGRARHPNWTQIDDVADKVSAREPHVLKVETKTDGSFYPKSKQLNGQTFQMEGFKGCHSENALKKYIQENGGTYTVKNKSVGQGGVYEGQPVISINNKEYVKINGRFVEYEPGKLGGTASFFPEGWSNAKIKKEVEHAIKNNHGLAQDGSNTFYGYSKDGSVEIRFYLNNDGYIGSYFPKKIN